MTTFGRTLSSLMKSARLTRPAVANELHVSTALVDKWKSKATKPTNQRRPSHKQFVTLCTLFAPHLTPQTMHQWAAQGGYHLTLPDLAHVFPPRTPHPAPEPDSSITYQRLDPLPPHTLFGVEAQRKRLLSALNEQDECWLFSIEGIGGIGKTVLANRVVSDVLRQRGFHDVIWLSAKQREFSPLVGWQETGRPALSADSFVEQLLYEFDPARALICPPQERLAVLTDWLKQNRYLVVIDNLETVADYEVLLPTLGRLAQPTKFLLTSREQVNRAYRVSLNELSRADSLNFLRYFGDHQQILALSHADKPDLDRIYDIAGGNPLALKLIVGQLSQSYDQLNEVLERLQQAQGRTVNQLYTHIYWQAWHDLDAVTRRLFVITPQLPNASLTDLSTVSQLDGERLRRAVHQLVRRSLLNLQQVPHQAPYHIHRLTETFLLNEVIQWKTLG